MIGTEVQNRPAYMNAIDKISTLAHVGTQETDLVILKGNKAILAPLTGAEEQKLKGANVSMITFLKEFDKILFDKILNKEELGMKTFEDFVKKITPQDKTLLVLSLSLSSFAKLGYVNTVCTKCGNEYPVEVKPDELWHEDSLETAWDKDIDPFEYREQQSFLDGNLIFDIGIPTEDVRLQVMSKIAGTQEDGEMNIMDTIAFFVKKITVKDGIKKGKDLVLDDIKKDIIPFLQDLPTKVKDLILNDIDLTIFDKYMPKLYQESRCNRCTTPNKTDINIENEFFRKALQLF